MTVLHDHPFLRGPDGLYVDQSVEAAAVRRAINNAAYEAERELPHNQRAAGNYFGVIVFDNVWAANVWCHACGGSLNDAIPVEPGGRVLRNATVCREGHLITITTHTGDVLHDCVTG